MRKKYIREEKTKMITVIGLGVKKGDLTKAGEEEILRVANENGKILVRTAQTASYENVRALGVPHETLDKIYAKSRTFETLNKNLSGEVLKYRENAAYLVDGAASEDNSVKTLIRRAGKRNVRVIDGVSKTSAIASIANFKGCSYQSVSACDVQEIAGADGISAPLIVYDLDGADLAADVKLALSDRFGEETEVLFIRLDDGSAKKIPVYEIDRQKTYNCSCAVAVEKADLLKKKRFTTYDVLSILRRLRRPEDGCPWDKVQTSESIRMNVVEEAYELLDAINLKDDAKIMEETGDLLMQVAFHAVLKEEQGAFDFTDVVTGLCEKLITRHTHVFGGDAAVNAEDALKVWDKNKMKEKSQDTYTKSVCDVPNCFPALLQAQKVAKRVARGGWDEPDFDEAKNALESELSELKEAKESGDKSAVAEELGDALFSMATLARAVGADGEEALLDTVKKIQRRYAAYEKAVLADGKDVNALTKAERDAYYERVKQSEKNGGGRGED